MQRYTNDIYLTERTKLLEGVLCSSLTFTNAKGKQWGNGSLSDPTSALTYRDLDLAAAGTISQSEADQVFGVGYYITPIKMGTSVRAFAPLRIDKQLRDLGSGIGTYTASATMEYIVDGVSTTINALNYREDFIELTPKQTLSIRYTCNGSYYYSSGIPGSLPITYTESFEYQFVFAAVQNQYPLKPYTITDCICRCLELCEPLLMGEIPKYTLQGVSYHYEGANLVREIAEGSQADKYDKIIAPNFTMTQATLRECLQVIGSYIHAEPRLGYDPTGTGSMYEENTIIFDEYGREDRTNLAENGYVYRGITQSINDYCTEVSTNVANIVNTLNYTDGVITDPSRTTTRTLRTESVNVLMSESKAEVYTQFPIYSIDKVMCGMYYSNGELLQELIDITPYIFEAHEYNSNLSSYGGIYPYSKSYALYYTQGQKNIKGLFFKADEGTDTYLSEYAIANILNSVTDRNDFDAIIETSYPYLCFQITYTPIYSSKFSHAKGRMQNGNHAFTSIYAQSENLIETSYYGENIKGVAERLGNVQETRTYVFKDVSFLPKTGQILETPSGQMVITAVTWQMFHTHVRCTVALTNKYNALSQYVGVNSTKRVSEISEREAYSRDILIKEYAVIGDKQTDTSKLIRNKRVLLGAIVGGDNDNPISAVVCAGTLKKYFENGIPKYYNGVALPVVSSAFGNAMVFTWNYKDNYSAGTQLVRGLTQNWIQDIPYCDYYGRFYWYDFSLTTGLDVKNALAVADGGVAGGNTYGYPHKTTNAPIRTSKVEQGVTQYHNPVLVRKDSREVINVHYELEYITNRDDLIIGSACASKCTLVGTDLNRRTAKVYFYNESNFKFSKFPKSINELSFDYLGNPIAPARSIAIGQENIMQDQDGAYYITFELPKDSNNRVLSFTNWCIAYEQTTSEVIYSDEDGEETTITTVTGGEIVLACNNASNAYPDGAVTIYISTSNTNIKGV